MHTRSHGSPSVACTTRAASVRVHTPSSGARHDVVCICTAPTLPGLLRIACDE
jgi:hypothetical protein